MLDKPAQTAWRFFGFPHHPDVKYSWLCFIPTTMGGYKSATSAHLLQGLAPRASRVLHLPSNRSTDPHLDEDHLQSRSVSAIQLGMSS